jgi:protein-tyrosine-phosphatase
MAEVLLRARLAVVDPDVVVDSFGLLFDDRPAERNAVKAMARLGLDLSGHTAKKVSAEALRGTSLIVGMERQHVVEVAALDRDLFPRAFTLPELVRSVDVVGPRPDDVDLRSWVERAGSMRTPEDYVLRDPASEIADPMGSSARTFRACGDEIDRLLEVFVDLAWPPPQPRDHPVAPATSGGIHADRDRR